MNRILIIVLYCATSQASDVTPAFRDGDIIFHTSRSSQSLAVQRATKSPYSHMGIILHRGGKPFVFEAASTVEFTPLAKWMARGLDGHYVVKRLADSSTRLTAPAIGRLREQAQSIRGKPYDPAFEWSDDRFYCSELVWKLYERALGVELGKLHACVTSTWAIRSYQPRFGSDMEIVFRLMSVSSLRQRYSTLAS